VMFCQFSFFYEKEKTNINMINLKEFQILKVFGYCIGYTITLQCPVSIMF